MESRRQQVRERPAGKMPNDNLVRPNAVGIRQRQGRGRPVGIMRNDNLVRPNAVGIRQRQVRGRPGGIMPNDNSVRPNTGGIRYHIFLAGCLVFFTARLAVVLRLAVQHILLGVGPFLLLTVGMQAGSWLGSLV